MLIGNYLDNYFYGIVLKHLALILLLSLLPMMMVRFLAMQGRTLDAIRNSHRYSSQEQLAATRTLFEECKKGTKYKLNLRQWLLWNDKRRMLTTTMLDLQTIVASYASYPGRIQPPYQTEQNRSLTERM